MNIADLCDLLDMLAPLPAAEQAPEALLAELNIRLDEPELVWA